MLRLQVDLYPMSPEGVTAERSNRSHNDPFEPCLKARSLLRPGYLKKVFHLSCGGKNRDMHLSSENLRDRLPERAQIHRECPFINGNAQNRGAALGQTGKEIRVFLSVLLNRNSPALDLQARIHSREKLAPGVGFRNGNSGGDV